MKNFLKKSLCIALAVAVVAAAAPIFGVDFSDLFIKSDAAVQKTTKQFQCGDYVLSLLYNSDNRARIKKYLGDEVNVVIPETIDGYTVEAIDSEAFTDSAEGSVLVDGKEYWQNENLKNIESVVLPDSVFSIGESAFENCSKLSSVTLSSTLDYIGKKAFKGTALTELNLPEGFTSLHANAIEGTKITSLVFPESVTAISTDSLKCDTLEKVVFKGGLEYIGSKAFDYDNLKTVIFEKSMGRKNVMGFGGLDDVWRDEETGFWYGVRYEGTDYEAALDESKLISNGYYKYFINSNNEAVIVKFTSMSTSGITIGESVSTKEYIPVVEILPYAFEGCDFLQVLTLPSTIRRIGAGAFYNCEMLRKINLPEGLKAIESNTFFNCYDLNNIDIPESVTEICGSAFERCINLWNVYGGESVEIIGKYAFSECLLLGNITLYEGLKVIEPYTFHKAGSFGEFILPEGLEEIGYAAFYETYISTVVLPDSLKHIGNYAFYNCRLSAVDLPDGLETLGNAAFQKNKIKELVIPPELTELSPACFAENQIKSIVIPSNIKVVGTGAFSQCGLTQVTIENGVEAIYGIAFSYINSSNLPTAVDELTIPPSVKVMQSSTLDGIDIGVLNINADFELLGGSESDYLIGQFSNIATVNFGDGVKSVCDYFSSNAYRIKELNLADSIETIGKNAFYNYDNFTELELPANLKTIGDKAFYGCNNLASVALPEGVTYIGKNAFNSCTSLKSVEFPDAVETLGAGAYSNCESLEEIVLPKNVVTVEDNTFSDCTGLKKITIPENVQKISPSAFDGCTAVETVDFYPVRCTVVSAEEADPDNLPLSLFYSMENLKNVVIHNTVKELPPYFLCGMQNIRVIELPESVTDIGAGAFANSSIKNLVVHGNIESIEEYAFKNCESLTEAPLKNGIMLIGTEAFYGCKSLESVYIPDSIFNIEIGAFAECESLESVRMSPNVDYIPRKTFYNCVKLCEFEWNSGSKLIGRLAFGNCVKLEDFDFVNVEKLYVNSFLGSGVTVVQLGESENEASPTPLTTVEVQSFKACENLATLGIGGNVTTIKTQAFADCTNLETAVIADSVTEIADDAFDGCDKLTIYCAENSYAHSYAQAQGINVSTFVIAPIPNQTYTGFEIKPDVSVSLSGNALDESVDFGVTYANNINVGNADVTVKGKGDFRMFASRANFAIVTRKISAATVAPIVEQAYTGSAVTPAITITDGGNVLREGVDYTVTYKNNVESGTATAEIKGIGNWSGTVTAQFEIEQLDPIRRAVNGLISFFNSFFARIKAFLVGIFM